MLKTRLVTIVALAGLLAATGDASAGWVIDQVLKGAGDGGRQQVVLQGNRLKSVALGPDGRPQAAFIIDLNADTIVQVNYEQREYVSSTLQEVTQWIAGSAQAAATQMSQAMQQMQEAMKNMPPEQRKQMEQMVRSQMPQGGQAGGNCVAPKRESRKTTQQATIAGFPAVRHDILADGQPESEIWVAPGLPAWKELDPKKLERFSSEMAKAVPDCLGGRARPGIGADPSWKLAAEGYPVRMVTQGTMLEVVKAESRSVPPAEFQPPAGFTRKTIRDMMGQ